MNYGRTDIYPILLIIRYKGDMFAVDSIFMVSIEKIPQKKGLTKNAGKH